MTDRGRDVSQELTEVRTVLSRAENAIKNIQRMRAEPFETDARYGGNYGFDPDGESMIAALQECVTHLEQWRKTGSTKRRV